MGVEEGHQLLERGGYLFLDLRCVVPPCLLDEPREWRPALEGGAACANTL